MLTPECAVPYRNVDARMYGTLITGMLTPECAVPYEKKQDCGYYGILEGECLKRGCCYKPSALPNDAICFQKAGSRNYALICLFIR